MIQVIRIESNGRIYYVVKMMRTVARETVNCASKADSLTYSAKSSAFIDSAMSTPTRRPLVNA